MATDLSSSYSTPWTSYANRNVPKTGTTNGNTTVVVTNPESNNQVPQTPQVPGTTLPTTTNGAIPTVVPGAADPNVPGQINVVDWASQVAANPQLGMGQGTNLTQAWNNTQTESAAQIDPKASWNIKSNITAGPAAQATANQATYTSAGQAAQAAQVNPQTAALVDAQTSIDAINQQAQMQAAQGQINQNNLVDPAQADMQGLYSGTNADGSTNYAGKALNEFQTQNMSNIIDTTTAAGKALAEQLGEFNYLDSKATMKGQLELLQKEFTGPNGEPKIPFWAAATARSVGRIAAFNGVTGTAATAAMAQALLEASLPIAQADSQFYQTLTLQNLTNKQASTINKANVLAKFELTNLDNRMTAAVENAKAFLQMDLANLSNQQQANLVNTQSRVQAILEDSKAVNTARMFNAEQQNGMAQFYDQLNSNISMFNAEQKNGMAQFNAAQANQVSMFNTGQTNQVSMFNAGQLNEMAQFNANLAVQQDQFYKTMQYNIDVANANWRNQLIQQNNAFKFQAAATDVKNLFDLSQEQLNHIWDRSDSLLDYLWQSSESEANRQHDLARIKLQGDLNADLEDSKGWGSVWGTIIGQGAESLFDSLW